MARIESLLSARLFLAPQPAGGRLFFISNLGGRLSLFAMDDAGSVPEPLLPPHIALQNPELIGGRPFCVFPRIGKIVVMIDSDGDENYQPMIIPIDGGFPEPAFGERLAGFRVHCAKYDADRGLVYFDAESRREPVQVAYRGNLRNGALEELGRSAHGCSVAGVDGSHTKVVLIDNYALGDHVVFLWTEGQGERRLLYGVPLEARKEGKKVPLNAIGNPWFTSSGKGLLFTTSLFTDTYGLGSLDLDKPSEVTPVTVTGAVHQGMGELVGLEHLRGERYLVEYNIDGCAWLYEGTYVEAELRMRLDHVVCGRGALANGVLEGTSYDKEGDRFALSHSTATSPTQIHTVEGADRSTVRTHTRERILGVPAGMLSSGEDASFASFDGQRVSARLYLPSPELGYKGARPLVYYVHGGPQSQERPNFAWFSMPLIQHLTLSGFAVFVPNARGSVGYGLAWTKHVDRDWGGNDRLDHVHAMKLLAKDGRVDVARAAVMGRSYGGYMTLTLAARHPELWSAAIDMFGPFDLITFLDRIPETWKPYFDLALGDPVKDRAFLVERSPRTYIDSVRCPLFVIQGRNDPRVVERESRDLVEHLRSTGKQVEYLVFENEGHDVLKFENRVRCYDAIAEFFKKYLKP